jgi:hypothetical protein
LRPLRLCPGRVRGGGARAAMRGRGEQRERYQKPLPWTYPKCFYGPTETALHLIRPPKLNGGKSIDASQVWRGSGVRAQRVSELFGCVRRVLKVGAPGRPCGAQEQQDQHQNIRRNTPMPLRIAYRRVLRIIHLWGNGKVARFGPKIPS